MSKFKFQMVKIGNSNNMAKQPYGTRKSRLKQSALRLFADKGISETTTRQISQMAGSAEGTLYRHYNSKEHLALALFTESMEVFKNFLFEKISGKNDSFNKIKALVSGFIEFAVNFPVEYTYITSGHDRSFRKLPKDTFKPKDVFVQVIQEGQKNGAFRKMEPHLAVGMIIGMCSKTHFFYKEGLLHISLEEAVKEIQKSALTILGC